MRELLVDDGYQVFFTIGMVTSAIACITTLFVSSNRFKYTPLYNYEKDPPMRIRNEEI